MDLLPTKHCISPSPPPSDVSDRSSSAGPEPRRLNNVCSAILVLVASLGLWSCGGDSTQPPPPERLPLGVHVLQRGAPGGDPLFVEAYTDLRRAGFSYGQFEIEWGAVELAIGNYDWKPVDDHVRQSLTWGVSLSVVVTLIDGEHLGRLPDDLRGQALGTANVRVRFARFLRDLRDRGRGTIDHIWVGRNVNELLEDDGTLSEDFRNAVAAGQDSLLSTGGGPDVGTIFSAGDEVPTDLVDYLEPELDRVGWSILGTDDSFEQELSSEELTARIAEVVAASTDLPVSIVETGFRRDSVNEAADFAKRLTEYLEDAPDHLEEVTWFALYDFFQSEAEDRADRIFPDDAKARSDLIDWLRICGLGDVSGAPTEVWTVFADWNAGL